MPIIGREPPADIVVPAGQVSARHASVEHVRGNQYLLTDLNSTNGTYVNGRRVQSAFVTPGDQIGLGSYRFDLNAWLPLIPRAAVTPPPLPSYAAVGASPMMAQTAPRDAPPPPLASPPGPTAAAEPPAGRPAPATDLAVALASQKSFTGKALLVWLLYWVLWLPGFVMNLVFLSEAKQVERVTGHPPPGKGCLVTLLVFYVAVPALLIFLLIVTGGAILHNLFR